MPKKDLFACPVCGGLSHDGEPIEVTEFWVKNPPDLDKPEGERERRFADHAEARRFAVKAKQPVELGLSDGCRMPDDPSAPPLVL